MPAPEVLRGAANADGLRDMQGLAARLFGGRSAAEPGVARTKAEPPSICRQPQKNYAFVCNSNKKNYIKTQIIWPINPR